MAYTTPSVATILGAVNAQRLETAREFFTVLASAYGLQARADAETKPDAA